MASLIHVQVIPLHSGVFNGATVLRPRRDSRLAASPAETKTKQMIFIGPSIALLGSSDIVPISLHTVLRKGSPL